MIDDEYQFTTATRNMLLLISFVSYSHTVFKKPLVGAGQLGSSVS